MTITQQQAIFNEKQNFKLSYILIYEKYKTKVGIANYLAMLCYILLSTSIF